MPRPKRPVILRKDNLSKRFNSISDAAAFLGVKSASVSLAIRHRRRHHTVHGFTVEYDGDAVESRPLKEESTKHIGLEVEIGGKTYCSESMLDKKNCTICDIYKAKPPMSMIQFPLCYDHSLGNRRVYSYCESNHCLVWKLKKSNG